MINKEILTVEEVAEFLRVSERTVYEWAQKGTIPCGKLGTVWRFKRADVVRWVDENLSAAPKDESEFVSQGYFLLRDVLEPERILISPKCDKQQVLTKLCEMLALSPEVTAPKQLARKMFHRESLMSTGIGLGCGIPHVRLDSVKKPVMALGIFAQGIDDYAALDGEPVRLVFMIAAGTRQHEDYVKLLAKVSARIKNDILRKKLVGAKSPQQAWDILASPDISEQ